MLKPLAQEWAGSRARASCFSLSSLANCDPRQRSFLLYLPSEQRLFYPQPPTLVHSSGAISRKNKHIYSVYNGWPSSKPNQTQTTADLILSSVSTKGRTPFLVVRIETDSLQVIGEHFDTKSFTAIQFYWTLEQCAKVPCSTRQRCHTWLK